MKGLGVWRFGRLAVWAFGCWGVWALRMSSAWAACGVAPERCDDFFWENDKVGFRAYGPRDPHLWSGIDVFNKGHVEDEVVKLLRGKDACGAWHNLATLKGGVRTFDNYTMGASRGVGGVAFWGDGEWKTYPNWVTSEVLPAPDGALAFTLVYPAFAGAGKMTCRITMKRGERFFRNDVSFERAFRGDFRAGPGLDLDPARGHRGSLVEAPGLVSLFEDEKRDAQGNPEGSTMSVIVVADPSAVEVRTDHMNCRVLLFKKRSFTYWAGASWSGAGEIVTPEAWHAHVRNFQEEIMKGIR